MTYEPKDFPPVTTLEDLEALVTTCRANPELPTYFVWELIHGRRTNARAAAVTLLDALESAETWIVNHVAPDTIGYYPELTAIRAALAKAAGE
jgi:hypothetical protein